MVGGRDISMYMYGWTNRRTDWTFVHLFIYFFIVACFYSARTREGVQLAFEELVEKVVKKTYPFVTQDRILYLPGLGLSETTTTTTAFNIDFFLYKDLLYLYLASTNNLLLLLDQSTGTCKFSISWELLRGKALSQLSKLLETENKQSNNIIINIVLHKV